MGKIFLKLGLLTFLILASSSLAAEAAPVVIGKVIIASGNDVKAIETNKKVRVLTRLSPIYQGDTLVTGKDSRVQIRFVDDTSISMRADSEIRVDNYKFDSQNEKDNKNFTTLVKGGFRTLTGSIAKQDPNKYAIKTDVAIIGVRGTDYTAVIVEDKKGKKELYTTVWSGRTTLTNKAGQLELGAGKQYQSAMVDSETSLPQGLIQPPDVITKCPR